MTELTCHIAAVFKAARMFAPVARPYARNIVPANAATATNNSRLSVRGY